MSPQTKKEYLFIIHTFMLILENLGGVILLILFTIMIAHLDIIYMIKRIDIHHKIIIPVCGVFV